MIAAKGGNSRWAINQNGNGIKTYCTNPRSLHSGKWRKNDDKPPSGILFLSFLGNALPLPSETFAKNAKIPPFKVSVGSAIRVILMTYD